MWVSKFMTREFFKPPPRKSTTPPPRRVALAEPMPGDPPPRTDTNLRSYANPAALTIHERRQAAFDLRIQGYFVKDIAKALKVHENTIAADLTACIADLQKNTQAAAEELRSMDLARLDMMLLELWPNRKWLKVQEGILMILERKHKLMGLDSSKTVLEASINSNVQIGVGQLDLSKLNDEQIGWLEIIIRVAGPQPTSAPAQTGPGEAFDATATEAEMLPAPAPTSTRVRLRDAQPST